MDLAAVRAYAAIAQQAGRIQAQNPAEEAAGAGAHSAADARNEVDRPAHGVQRDGDAQNAAAARNELRNAEQTSQSKVAKEERQESRRLAQATASNRLLVAATQATPWCASSCFAGLAATELSLVEGVCPL